MFWTGLKGVVSSLLIAMPASVLADFAILVDQGTLVQTNPEAAAALEPGEVETASYVGVGGWAVSGTGFIDVATSSFDFVNTTSVSAATLRYQIEEIYLQNGAAPLRISFFSDDGSIEYDDYAVGFVQPLAQIDAAGLTEIVVDVTGPVNAALQSGRFVGFRVRSAIEPANVQTSLFPPYAGVRLALNPTLEFVPGAAPSLPVDEARFDGFSLQVPTIDAGTIGEGRATLQLVDPNNLIFQLSAAEVLSAGTGTPPRSGIELLNCSAFSQPVVADVAEGIASFSESSGILDIPSVDLNGDQVAIRLEYIEGSNPWRFETLSLTAVQTGTQGASVSELDGGILLEPTQDFIPLCHGWVLIGDFIRNRVVERNLLSGETGGVYQFNTRPEQFVLDSDRNLVHMTVHPESARIYTLNLVTGAIDWDPINFTFGGVDAFTYQYAFTLRDLALGENGNLFSIMYDGQTEEDPGNSVPYTSTRLWLGLFDTAGNFLTDPLPLAEPRRIEYDPVRRHLFLTSDTHLATFDFDPVSNVHTFVQGTDSQVGANCTDFDIAPDGSRLAFTCPLGNYVEEEFSVVDMDPRQYFNNDGEWHFADTPISSTFSADGTLMLGADNQRIYLFDVKTHLLLEDFELGLLEGETVKQVRFSRDGQLIYLFIDNTFHADNSKFYWMHTPAISGSPL
jgi:hypothetical protein